MKIQLSDHFTYGRLLRFTLPSIVMMVFTSIYSVVDGMFVSNIVGANALSSINIIMPLIMIVGAFGFMLGTGGCAEVSKTLGEGDGKRADEYFSLLISTIIVIGVSLSAVCIIFIRPVARLLGASDILMADCITYGVILLAGCTFFMLQTSFQTFFIAAERPHLGLALTVASGVANMVFDFLFVYVLRMGIAGAAFATVIGYAIGGLVPLFYFLAPNGSRLRLIRPRWYPRVLLRSSVNGASEMLSNISASIVTFLYNIQMMRLAGESGVAAITVIMYVNFIFVAILIGFAMGSAPIISYQYGAKGYDELKNLFRKCSTVILLCSAAMAALAELTARPVVSFFVGADAALMEMTVRGFRLYALAFLFCGVNIFASSFFTSLCNGRISAIISVLRSLVLQGILILVLPRLLGLDGVWLTAVFTEAGTLLVSLFFLLREKNEYFYL